MPYNRQINKEVYHLIHLFVYLTIALLWIIPPAITSLPS